MSPANFAIALTIKFTDNKGFIDDTIHVNVWEHKELPLTNANVNHDNPNESLRSA